MANYLNEAGLTTLLKDMKESIKKAFKTYNSQFAKIAKTGKYTDLVDAPNVVLQIKNTNEQGANIDEKPANNGTIDLTHLATKNYVDTQIKSITYDEDSEKTFGNLSYRIFDLTRKIKDINDDNGLSFSLVFNPNDNGVHAYFTYSSDSKGYEVFNNFFAELYRKDSYKSSTTSITPAALTILRMPTKVYWDPDNTKSQSKEINQDILITNMFDYTNAVNDLYYTKAIDAAKKTITDKDYLQQVIVMSGQVLGRGPKNISLDPIYYDTTNKKYPISDPKWTSGMGGRLKDIAQDMCQNIIIFAAKYTNYSAVTKDSKVTQSKTDKIVFYAIDNFLLQKENFENYISDIVNQLATVPVWNSSTSKIEKTYLATTNQIAQLENKIKALEEKIEQNHPTSSIIE